MKDSKSDPIIHVNIFKQSLFQSTSSQIDLKADLPKLHLKCCYLVILLIKYKELNISNKLIN